MSSPGKHSTEAFKRLKKKILDRHLHDMLHGVDVWVKITRIKH